MKHFKPAEFACRCGRCGQGYNGMDPELLERLDAAREAAGVPFRINSARRCAAHNAAVGSRPTSSHLTGNAVDIAVVSVGERFRVLKALLDVGFERIGIGRDFIHADVDPAKPSGVAWLY